MPGLCGFIIPSSLPHKAETLLASMQKSLVYRSRHRPSPLFTDHAVAASDVHFGFMDQSLAPWSDDRCSVWLDGEFFPPTTAAPVSLTGLIGASYREGNLFSFLRNGDGIFSAALYDRDKKLLHLITDRFGLRHLYLLKSGDGFAWCSEIKGFRALPWFTAQASPQSFLEFMTFGHFTGDLTWFDDVRLMAPGTVLSVDVESHSVTSLQYFSLSTDIPVDTADRGSVVGRLGTAFRDSINRRCKPGDRIGMGLSGGLDSRAIFAALPRHCEPVQAVTFGQSGCNDMRIAETVARLRPSHHTEQIIDSSNWLTNRAEGVWITDGQVNLLHMHGIEQIDAIPDLYDIELNGFLGDALLGGSYAASPGGEITQFLNRGRRMIATALVIGNLTYHTRLPFFDNDLLRLTLSIPPEERRHSRIYNDMLLTEFPEYFKSIPWQKTGIPISRKGPFWNGVRLFRKGTTALSRRLSMTSGNDYFDYGGWVRSSPAWGLFTRLLGSDDSIVRTFAAGKTIDSLLHRHERGENHADILCRYGTAEIWMRQFFRNEWPDV